MLVEKIKLPRDVIWRWCIFLSLACLLSYLVGQIFDQKTVFVDVETRWCLFGTYANMDSYKSENNRPQTSYITFRGEKVEVYAHCEEIKAK